MGRREQFTVGELTITEAIKRAGGDILKHLKTYVCTPAAKVADRYFASANMANGAYAVANGGLPGDGLAHNITVTHATVAAGTDTLGTITFVGEDIHGKAISEVITPLADQTAQGLKAFKKVTSMTQAGWVIAGGNDTLTIGFGDVIGLPDKIALAADIVLVGFETALVNAPTVTVDSLDVSKNTVMAVGNATKKLRVIYQL